MNLFINKVALLSLQGTLKNEVSGLKRWLPSVEWNKVSSSRIGWRPDDVDLELLVHAEI